MSKPPDLVAAEYALDRVDVERVPWYAADWLAGVHDGPALRELAGLDGTDTRLIGAMLRSPFRQGTFAPCRQDLTYSFCSTLSASCSFGTRVAV